MQRDGDALRTFITCPEPGCFARSREARGGVRPFETWTTSRELSSIPRCVEQLARQHVKQLLTYLELTNRQVGLLINFGAPTLREGLRRIVNGFQPSAFPRLRVNQSLPAKADSKSPTPE